MRSMMTVLDHQHVRPATEYCIFETEFLWPRLDPDLLCFFRLLPNPTTNTLLSNPTNNTHFRTLESKKTKKKGSGWCWCWCVGFPTDSSESGSPAQSWLLKFSSRGLVELRWFELLGLLYSTKFNFMLISNHLIQETKLNHQLLYKIFLKFTHLQSWFLKFYKKDDLKLSKLCILNMILRVQE